VREIIFNTSLSGVLDKSDVFLPLSAPDQARLLTQLPEDEFTFLTIRSTFATEHVLAVNKCGTIVLSRGVNGTEPAKFPRGSCVLFENSTAVTKWLVCNHDCCADKPCECEGVAVAGKYLPDGNVGNLWYGFVVFTGTLPMQIGTSPLPAWMAATVWPNAIMLSGTPTAPQPVTLSVSATNCKGTPATTATTLQILT